MSAIAIDPDPDPQHPAARALRWVEGALDRAFGTEANPLRQLGALATFAFWLALGSGAYLYVYFDTSADGALRSVQALETHAVNGIVRSLHRYASDAFLALTLAHIGVEWAKGRYRGFRWFSWITGMPLVLLAVATGLVGYWLIGDDIAQFVATGIGEWVGVLPGFGHSVVRNFVTAEAISDRLFSLLIFIHIGIGLLMLLALWVHLARLVRPRTQPQRRLAWGTTVALLALCIAWPALATAPADFARWPAVIAVDWLYYGILPLMDATSPAAAWLAVGAATALLALAPWMTRAARPQPAVVDVANCNGCKRCFADCPYGAVVMVPRTDARPYKLQARVLADQCAGCCICVGACPSSTPFRSVTELVTGIDLPQRPLDAVRAALAGGLAAARTHGVAPIVVFGCDHGASLAGVAAVADVIALPLPCSAALPPAFIDYAQRHGAHQVVVADCGVHACAYRFGARFTRERLAGTRAPRLRSHARGPNIEVVAAAVGEESVLAAAVARAGVRRATSREAARKKEALHV